MAYIGKTPVIGNFQKCDSISVVNGQAAYTLQVGGANVSPQSENHMLVSLNGILQAPVTSFTVSGSTLTFASNLVTGDVIDFVMILGNVLDLGVPSDNTVSLAKLTATGTKDATTFLRGDNTFAEAGGGITEADQWRITADNSSTGDITTNWERVDTTGQGILGTGMTESSGIFTFPSTGIWEVKFIITNYKNGENRNATFRIYYSSDAGSNFTQISNSSAFITQTEGSFTYSNAIAHTLLDITNISNDRVKFYFSGTTTLRGETDKNFTYATFIRLGDT